MIPGNMRGVVSTAGMTPAEIQRTKDEMMAKMRGNFAAMMQEQEDELDTPTEKSQIWVVFIDSEDREGGSVFYSWTTEAKSRTEAINKVSANPDCQYTPSELDARCPAFVQ
jgi:hypothetical protein